MKTEDLFEKTIEMPDWVAQEQAEFRRFISGFEFKLTPIKARPVGRGGNIQWYIGGRIIDAGTGGEDDIGLPAEQRFAGLKRALAQMLISKAQTGRYVKLVKRIGWWRDDDVAYVQPDDKLIQIERILNDKLFINTPQKTGMHGKARAELTIMWSISEPK